MELTPIQQELKNSLTSSELVEQWGGAIAQIKSVTDIQLIAANRQIPTLADVSVVFGNDTVIKIISEHLRSLCKNADTGLTTYQFADTSLLIATEYYYLNLAELSYFFRGCKIGRYGQLVWGSSLNIQQMMTAARRFLTERNEAIDRNEKRLIEQRKEKGFMKINMAAQCIVSGTDYIRDINEKAKNDFNAFCGLFPNLPKSYSPQTWWNAWKGENEALKLIYNGECPSPYIAERDIGEYLCEYNISLKK
nr:hypothetical protein [uncultured Bacteroides sp.]